MSDFSAGVFALSKNKDKVYPFLTKKDLFIQYNDQWVGKLSDTDYEERFQPQTIALSKEVPLLYIMNAEDHGFSMKILHDGNTTFQFELPYYAEAELAHELGYELFGEEWLFEPDKLEQRSKQANEEAAKILKEQGAPAIYFASINEENLKAFHVFDFSHDTLQEICEILTVENFVQGSHKMVFALLNCIGLTDFSFVAHSYVFTEDEDRFKVL